MMRCCSLALLAVATSTSVEEPDAELAGASAVLLQAAWGLNQEQGHRPSAGSGAVAPPESTPVPADLLAKVGRDGEAAWQLFPAAPPWTVPQAGPERTVPMSTDSPDFKACGGQELPHGYPKDFFDAHSVYNVAVPQLLPFVVPEGSPGRTDAAIIVAPGGANMHLVIDGEGHDVAAWLNSVGVSAFVLKYRVSTAAGVNMTELALARVADAQRAVSFVRHRANGLGINASRIGFMGFSAGGGLTVDVASLFRRAYDPIDGVDSAAFEPDFSLAIYPSTNAVMAMLIPDKWIPRMAPMFMALSEDDPCVGTGAVDFYMSVHKRGGPGSELHVYPSGGHGWGTCSRRPNINVSMGYDACSWTLSAQLFLKNMVLGGQEQASAKFGEKLKKTHPILFKEMTAEAERQAAEKRQAA